MTAHSSTQCLSAAMSSLLGMQQSSQYWICKIDCCCKSPEVHTSVESYVSWKSARDDSRTVTGPADWKLREMQEASVILEE